MCASSHVLKVLPLALLLALGPLASAEDTSRTYEALTTNKELVVWKGNTIWLLNPEEPRWRPLHRIDESGPIGGRKLCATSTHLYAVYWEVRAPYRLHAVEIGLSGKGSRKVAKTTYADVFGRQPELIYVREDKRFQCPPLSSRAVCTGKTLYVFCKTDTLFRGMTAIGIDITSGRIVSRRDSRVRYRAPHIFAYRGKVYSYDGASLRAYDRPSGRWKEKIRISTMTFPRWASSVCLWKNTLVVIGGAAGSGCPWMVDKHERINLDTLKIDTFPSGSIGPRRSPSLAYHGEGVFVWGGRREVYGQWLDSGGYYDVESMKWTPVEGRGRPIPREGATCLFTGKHIVIWGGRVGPHPMDDGKSYDRTTGKWSALPELPEVHPRPEPRGLTTTAPKVTRR